VTKDVVSVNDWLNAWTDYTYYRAKVSVMFQRRIIPTTLDEVIPYYHMWLNWHRFVSLKPTSLWEEIPFPEVIY
jgi:hypothetical protein